MFFFSCFFHGWFGGYPHDGRETFKWGPGVREPPGYLAGHFSHGSNGKPKSKMWQVDQCRMLNASREKNVEKWPHFSFSEWLVECTTVDRLCHQKKAATSSIDSVKWLRNDCCAFTIPYRRHYSSPLQRHFSWVNVRKSPITSRSWLHDATCKFGLRPIWSYL